MTDFENAALVTFIVLLTRAIMTYNLNLLIPISHVSGLDTNVRRLGTPIG